MAKSSQETAAPAFSHRASFVFTFISTVPYLGKGGTFLKISGSFSLNHLTSLYTNPVPMLHKLELLGDLMPL